MSATPDGYPADPPGDTPVPSPFTMVGDDAALCEGDACALPAAPAPSPRPLRHSATGSAEDRADSVAEYRTGAGVTPSG